MVTTTFLHSRTGRCLPFMLAALLFAGCGTQAPDQTAPHLEGTTQAGSGYYLSQMQQSANDSKTTWQLLAIRSLLQEGKLQQGLELFNQLPQNLTNTQQREQSMLAVEIKLAQKDYAGANALLAKVDVSTLNQNQQARYWNAQIAVSQGRPSLNVLRAYVAQEPLVSGKAKQANIDGTWQTLTSMTRDQANALVINADEATLQGWLDLQQMWFDNRSDPNMLKAGIKDWQTRYPQNPGAKLLPTQLGNLQNYQPASVNKIALLLPLSGQAAIFGQTIQQGFEAAKNNGVAPVNTLSAATPTDSTPVTAPDDQQAQSASTTTLNGEDTVSSPAAASVNDLTGEADTTQPAATQPDAAASQAPQQPAPQPVAAVSAAANPAAQVKIYDTSSLPLAQILAQAQQDGASLVVGPLLKEQVEQVATSPTSLNVLALNQPENVTNRANICYFALSPEDEARNAAEHIWQQGHRIPLILAPRNGALGDRVAQAFTQEWQSLGGSTVLQQKFGSVTELRGNINSGSGIALSGTPVTVTGNQPMMADAGLTGADASASGGNVDSVYIVASQQEVALLKPMIAMRTGSRNTAELYASSRSIQGGTGADFRLEMEGLQFSDIPMLSGANPSLMQQALSSVHNDYSLARLYAMGVDAWTLANHFSDIRQVPGYRINGNTGTLTADENCVVDRKLSWMKYQGGQIVPVN